MTTQNPLISMLESLNAREDRASLAALRRGLGQTAGSVPEVSRIVQRVLPSDAPNYLEIPYYIIAPLFGLHPIAGGTGNMGSHFRSLWTTGDPPSNIERRFMSLLASDLEELPDALRQAVTLLKSKGVPVNWAELLRNVQQWTHDERFVQKQWSRTFWRSASSANQTIDQQAAA